MPLILHNSDDHMVLYEIVGETFQKDVRIQNQLHEQQQTISVHEAKLLAVPSEKVSFEEAEPEPLVDHFLGYWITEATPLQAYVYLEDQFGALEAELGWPWYFCNPTEKWHNEVLTPVSNSDHHLTVYGLAYEEAPKEWFVEINNQFGSQQLTLWGPIALAVPTQKVEPWYHEPPVGLDHFLLYEVVEGRPWMQLSV